MTAIHSRADPKVNAKIGHLSLKAKPKSRTQGALRTRTWPQGFQHLSTALVLTTKVEMTKRKYIRNLTLKMTLVKIEKNKNLTPNQQVLDQL